MRQKLVSGILLHGDLRKLMMAKQEQRREQVTVPLDPALRAALEQAASREHRSIAGLIRHIVAIALEQRDQAAA